MAEGIYDFHTHSTLSDGVLSPMELVRRAVVHNYRAMAISDHAGLGGLDRLLREIAGDCAVASEHWGIVALPGVELTHVPPGAIPEAARLARAAGALVVLVHGETIVEPVEKGTNLAAISCSEVDILAHPGLITPEEAELAAANGVFLELSARRSHCLANGHVARVAKLVGAKLIVNSDQHDLDFLTEERARLVALGAGLSEDDLPEVLERNPRLLLERVLSRKPPPGK